MPDRPIIDINFRFRLIDPSLFRETLEHLEELGVKGASEGTLEEKVDAIVAHLDVLALSRGEQSPVGWIDVGLERITV